MSPINQGQAHKPTGRLIWKMVDRAALQQKRPFNDLAKVSREYRPRISAADKAQVANHPER
jgi:hypothetical protein